MNSLRIAILMGGPSREHDVSLLSAEAIKKELQARKHTVHEVFISLTRQWSIDNAKPTDSITAIKSLKKRGVELVFLALHGSFGEDGSIQALLQKMDMNFTGSDAQASLLAMDKITSAELFRANGLKVPDGFTFTRYELMKDPKLGSSLDSLGYPLIVKPASQGSSLGVSLVEQKQDLFPAVEFALEHDNKIIVQRQIAGREVSCGVIEHPNTGKLQALTPTELIPVDADFFDYHAKYTVGAANEITPPDLQGSILKKIQNIAVQAHQLIGCKGYSRTDMIIQNKYIFIIETNTLPGMSVVSILPSQAKASGISFGDMLEQIIKCALNKPV